MQSDRGASFYRWAYTATTRTSKNLIIVNAPKFSPTSSMKWQENNPPPTKETTTKGDTENTFEQINFKSSSQELKNYYRTFKKHWQINGFFIINIEHFQYCERYTLSHQNQSFIIQFFYNAKFQITRTECVKNNALDSQIIQQALSVIKNPAH